MLNDMFGWHRSLIRSGDVRQSVRWSVNHFSACPGSWGGRWYHDAAVEF